MKAQNGEETIFAAALALPLEERATYLDESCGDDEDLRRRVEVLLQAHVGSEFLEQPASPLAAQTLRISLVISERPGDMIGRYKLLQQIGEGGCGVVYMAEQEKPGDKIGHYKLLQQIGEGGCGMVYMAEQEEPVRRRVALKVIKLGMDTKQVIARFEAERQALAMMDHPNIAKVLDGERFGRSRRLRSGRRSAVFPCRRDTWLYPIVSLPIPVSLKIFGSDFNRSLGKLVLFLDFGLAVAMGKIAWRPHWNRINKSRFLQKESMLSPHNVHGLAFAGLLD